MTMIAIIHHSGYGHTHRQAEAVTQGVQETGTTVHLLTIDANGDLPQESWDILQSADGVIFGSPTYMGGPSWQFKKFADTSSKIWFAHGWKDKFAAGFTNSGSLNGDKFSTLSYFVTLAMQHAMVWVGLDIMPANKKASTRADLNHLGGFTGALAQSPADAAVSEMYPGDLETAAALGRRFAKFVGTHRAG